MREYQKEVFARCLARFDSVVLATDAAPLIIAPFFDLYCETVYALFDAQNENVWPQNPTHKMALNFHDASLKHENGDTNAAIDLVRAAVTADPRFALPIQERLRAWV